MQKLSLYLLGPFQAMLEGQPVGGFAYDKVRALLAYLAVEARTPHHRESLATLLWPEDAPVAARASFRKALSTLCQAIQNNNVAPPYLIIEHNHVQFNTASQHWLDVAVLQSKLDATTAHSHPPAEPCSTCIQNLEEAVSLYRDVFLQGLIVGDSAEFEEWSLTYREHLHARVLTALHTLTLHHLHWGRYSRAQQYALRQIEMEPYREEAHRALMTVLASGGQRSAALAQYETCCRILADELDVEPSSETQALYERIRSAGQAHPHNLPLPLPPILGRSAELQTIGAHLVNPDCRLLTLVGVGGIGKTSLALHAAQEHLGDFLNGTYWVSMASVSHSDQVLTAILNALPIALNGSSDPKTQLLDYLRQKSMLLALDNFEHLLPPAQAGCNAGLDMINGIVQTAPHVKLLVTSRERLCLRSEWVIHVDGLPCPEDPAHTDPHTLQDNPAVRLFVGRARQVSAGFATSQKDYLLIARICQLLYGIPLGIEHAAGWVDQQPCQTILDEIERDLDFLVTSLRDVPDRHQSLRAVFEHSWKLLSAGEQGVLRRLSVFRDSFNREAARQVGDATPTQLTAFANKSFLRGDTGGGYHMHPLLRQFLAEELAAHPAEAENTRRAHAGHYANFLKVREPRLVVRHQIAPFNEVGAAIVDVQAAWEWSVAQGATNLLEQMLDSLYVYFWAHNQFQEGKALLEKAAQALPQTCLLQARISSRLAEFISWLGDLEEAEKSLRHSVNLLQSFNDASELAFSQELLGRVYYWQGNYHQSRQILAIATETARLSGAKHHLAQALCTLASVICEESADYETANRLYGESLAIYQELDNLVGIAKVLINQGAIFYEQGDSQQARNCYQRSLELYRQAGYAYGVSAVLNNLAIVNRKLGDYASAHKLVQESLSLKRETGNRIAILHSLLEIGALSTEMCEHAAAHDYFCEALQLALQTQSRGLLFDILVGFAELFEKRGETTRALEIAAWVLAQQGVGQEARSQAETLHAGLEKRLSAKDLAQCQQHASTREIDQIVSALL